MNFHTSSKSTRAKKSRYTQNTHAEENLSSILFTSSTLTSTSPIAQLQRVIGNKATQSLLRTDATLQREPVKTIYGEYDSEVLKTQQARVESLLKTLGAFEGQELPPYQWSSGGFMAWTGLDTFPETRKTPGKKGRREQQHYQGWKVHYGVKPDQASELANLILPIAQKYKIVHKIVAELETYAMDSDPNQLGKYITLYPASMEQLFQIVNEIETALMSLDIARLQAQEKTAAEYELGASGLATTRYGSFTGKEVYVPNEEGGMRIPDDRTRAYPPQLEGEFKLITEMNHELISGLMMINGTLDQGSSSSSSMSNVDTSLPSGEASSSGLGGGSQDDSQATSSSSSSASRVRRDRPRGQIFDTDRLGTAMEKEEKKTRRRGGVFSPLSLDET